MDMKTDSPRVSIGLPVYNGELRLRRALDSVLSQDFVDFEVVIADNASTDGTQALCEAYAARDARVRYSRNPQNIGVNPNHDRVFNLSRGKYFTWFADDVEYLPGMLSRCVAGIEQAGTATVLVFPGCEVVQDGRPQPPRTGSSIALSDPRPYQRVLAVVRHVNYVNQLYGLIRREALAKTQLNGRYASSDYVLLAELAMQGEIRQLPETLLRRRIDSNRGTASFQDNPQAWHAWSGAGRRSRKDAWLACRERLALEYLLAAWRMPMAPGAKLMCLLAIPPVYYERNSASARTVLHLLRPWRWGRKSPATKPVACPSNG